MSEQALPGAAQVPAARGLFVRQSSGLIREFRPSDVFIFNTLGYALGLGGTYKLGPTLGINPGSEYNEGVLRGALVEIKKGKLKSHQFTAG